MLFRSASFPASPEISSDFLLGFPPFQHSFRIHAQFLKPSTMFPNNLRGGASVDDVDGKNQ
jgi:hypothetical protein